ncbi:trifunctional serine/threonine-protein kinase/ATP-binding protein/sensor histidine kinase [Archangium lipolyticum]|uniref:trifunctional serine/threonine-protein kinase/ATP-binding protein/sensor histidine kinase n=1 Tax=Archangium lipolyticum TaxID=2970465 RepID=UPI002149E69B|nr:AAA family ATPase [Archangium lipolyticum]
MSRISQYKVLGVLHQGEMHTLYRALRQADGRPVVIKVPVTARMDSREVVRLEREFMLTRRCQSSPHVVDAIEFLQLPGIAALVLEDFQGRALDRMISGPLEIRAFLRLAIAMASALADIHRHEIVHLDIKPANIIVNDAMGEVKVTDFGIASTLPLEHRSFRPASTVEGTFAYLSPEQTGRMNRSVDHRSDLYSLGITFYEMLVGELPFSAEDVLGWFHCHLAVVPRQVCEVNPSVPVALSRIVARLMAKAPEDRYQSAEGLKADLEQCAARWDSGAELSPFPLGTADALDWFRIPEKLYGRADDVSALLDAFERGVKEGRCSLALVSGYSGVGKSSLVNEVFRPLVRERGLFASGKFDQLNTGGPYSILMSALRQCTQQILAEGEAETSVWKERIQRALGPNGQLVVDLLPQLELIIGRQDAVEELGPAESLNRLHEVFAHFFGALSQDNRPLVLFLDDLQWVDPATLALLQHVIPHPDAGCLFVIGSYRDNEVTPSHPLMVALDSLRRAEVPITDIVLSPLGLEHIQHLLADTLHTDEARVLPLARLLADRTGGNPFFLTQFLGTLHREKLLRFDVATREWCWDLAQLQAKGFTDNVVALMVAKLRELPSATLDALRVASCIGNTFDSEDISGLVQKSTQELEANLFDAVKERLILRSEDAYRFLHDRVQQAAYLLTPEEQRIRLHLRIGRMLRTRRPSAVFAVVNHLNLAAALIDGGDEVIELARLNLEAGESAMRSGAHAAALSYLAAGCDCVGENGWESHYELTYALSFQQAQCQIISGQLGAAEAKISTLLAHARSRAEQADVHRLKVDLHATRGEFPQAVEAALSCARLFGIELSPRPTPEALRATVQAMWDELAQHKLESLADLPPMTDPDQKALLALFAAVLPPAYFINPDLHDLLACQMVGASLRHGNADDSVMGYVVFGQAIGHVLRMWREAVRLGAFAVDLMDRRGIVGSRAKVCLVIGGFINHRIQHLRDVLPLFQGSWSAAREAGEHTFASYSSMNMVVYRFMMGDHLEDVIAEAETSMDFTRRTRNDAVWVPIADLREVAECLRQRTEPPQDPPDMGAGLRTVPFIAFMFHRYRLLCRLIYGDIPGAVEMAWKSRDFLAAYTGQAGVAEYHFHAALALARHYDAVTPEEKREYLGQIEAHLAVLQEWAETGPENHGHAYTLISAELARIRGSIEEAIRLYEESIRQARQNGFIQSEALAYEVASEFYLARGVETVAQAYLREARRAYLQWGAHGKVKQLDMKHPHLVRSSASTTSSTGPATDEAFDLMTVVKAQQAISGEIVLEGLLKTLMRILIESAGAERGCLLLSRDDTLFVEAWAEVEREEIKVDVARGPLEGSAHLPLSIVSYVKRSLESLILADADADSRFASDEYVVRAKPRSILCMPVRGQAKLAGVLYLENRLAAGVFTPSRLAVLEVLASQASISLANAKLYASVQQAEEALRRSHDELERRVEERARELRRAQAELLDTARRAGKAEIAADVLHNAGNILNSVNTSAGIVASKLRQFPVSKLARAAALLQDHQGDLGEFLVKDEAGRRLPTYFALLAQTMREELDFTLGELDSMMASVEHLNEVVRTQHAYVGVLEAAELIHPEDLLENALRMNTPALEPLRVRIIKDYAALPALHLQRSRVVQILANLISNAAWALSVSDREEKWIKLELKMRGARLLRISVSDNGVGIAPEDVEKLFRPGFSTRKDGHGFGLHSSALTAKAMGGSILVQSEGPGRGALFTLELPLVKPGS